MHTNYRKLQRLSLGFYVFTTKKLNILSLKKLYKVNGIV